MRRELVDPQVREVLVDLRMDHGPRLGPERTAQIAQRAWRRYQHKPVESAALRCLVENAGHIATELLLLELVPVNMRLEGMPADQAARLGAAGAVGADLARWRHRPAELAIDR